MDEILKYKLVRQAYIISVVGHIYTSCFTVYMTFRHHAIVRVVVCDRERPKCVLAQYLVLLVVIYVYHG